MEHSILSAIVWTPLLAALVVLAMPTRSENVLRSVSFALSLVPFLLSLRMLQLFDPTVGTLQLNEHASWMPSLGVSYSLGVDGFSL